MIVESGIDDDGRKLKINIDRNYFADKIRKCLDKAMRDDSDGKDDFRIIKYTQGIKVCGIDIDSLLGQLDSTMKNKAKDFGLYGLFCNQCNAINFRTQDEEDIPNYKTISAGGNRTLMKNCVACGCDTTHQLDWVIQFTE